jgi:hypothetical protein
MLIWIRGSAVVSTAMRTTPLLVLRLALELDEQLGVLEHPQVLRHGRLAR